MSISSLDIDQITEADLANVLATGVPEGVTLEYKEQRYGNADAEVKEFLKDVSSFANSMGGHLVIGMSEVDGVPTGMTPLTTPAADDELLRLENLVRTGIEPRITGTRMKAVTIAAGGYVIVIRVPRSWNPPHRVSAKNTNRFYVRNSAGVHEVSVEELRVLFSLSATAQDRVRAFRQERLAKIAAGETPVPIVKVDNRLVMHVVPLSAFTGRDLVDVKAARTLHDKLQPISSVGYTPRFNFDGFINARGQSDCYGYTQLFRNGAIEAVKVDILMEFKGRRVIPSLTFDQHIIEVLPGYLSALQLLGVAPPIVVMLTVEGVAGAYLGAEQRQFIYDDPLPFAYRTLELPEVYIEDYSNEASCVRALRPAFDALWNAGGFGSSKHFDNEGIWVGAPGA